MRKAGITILADYRVQNFAHQIACELSQKYGVAFFASLYPAHISLKQPFTCEDLPRLEAYCDELAAQTAPFSIELDELYADAWEGNGILGLRVVETSALRELHNRLNRQLSLLFADSSAPDDGEDYRFHLTIEMGKIGPPDPLGETSPEAGRAIFNPYRAYVESLADKKTGLSFQAAQLGLFTAAGNEQNRYMLYKVIPLRPIFRGIWKAGA